MENENKFLSELEQSLKEMQQMRKSKSEQPSWRELFDLTSTEILAIQKENEKLQGHLLEIVIPNLEKENEKSKFIIDTLGNMVNSYADELKEERENTSKCSRFTEKLQSELSSIKRKIADGKMIELPCKVGDLVYFDTYINNARTSIGVKPHEVKRIKVVYCADGADIPDWEIGKTIFLTQEEAEQNLKEN